MNWSSRRLRSLVLPPPILVVLSLAAAASVDRVGLSDPTHRASLGSPSSLEKGPTREDVDLGDAASRQGELSVIWGHPLFSQSRQPWPEPEPEPEWELAADPEPEVEPVEELADPIEVAEPEPPPPPLTQVELVGSLDGKGTRSALVRRVEDGQELWLEEGSVIGEWTVIEVQRFSIRLRAGGEELQVKLNREPSSAP